MSVYLIGLSNVDADKERNLQLQQERGWFDIPVVYTNKRRALLEMKKGGAGEGNRTLVISLQGVRDPLSH